MIYKLIFNTSQPALLFRVRSCEIGFLCKEIPDESLLLNQIYLNPLVTISGEICESLIPKNDVCVSTPKTEI